MDLQLADKIALVTGSTAGIGNAIAASLAREGAAVIVSGRTDAAVEARRGGDAGRHRRRRERFRRRLERGRGGRGAGARHPASISW